MELLDEYVQVRAERGIVVASIPNDPLQNHQPTLTMRNLLTCFPEVHKRIRDNDVRIYRVAANPEKHLTVSLESLQRSARNSYEFLAVLQSVYQWWATPLPLRLPTAGEPLNGWGLWTLPLSLPTQFSSTSSSTQPLVLQLEETPPSQPTQPSPSAQEFVFNLPPQLSPSASNLFTQPSPSTQEFVFNLPQLPPPEQVFLPPASSEVLTAQAERFALNQVPVSVSVRESAEGGWLFSSQDALSGDYPTREEAERAAALYALIQVEGEQWTIPWTGGVSFAGTSAQPLQDAWALLTTLRTA